MRTWFLSLFSLFTLSLPLYAQALPGTKLLEGKDDFAKVMVDGIGTYLDRELAAAPAKRSLLWKPDFSSPQAYEKSVALHRERLKHILGIVDKREPTEMHYDTPVGEPALLAQTSRWKAYTVRWSVLPGIEGEGLLLEPEGKVKANVVAIPDADSPWNPETASGMGFNLNKDVELGRRLAHAGYRVIVPAIIDRRDEGSGNPRLKRWTNQSHREFVYRMSYQMGRHIIGYEVQRILAAVDWFKATHKETPVWVAGYGDGGLLALCSAALDSRIQHTLLSGYFGPREKLHQEPIDRNIWSFLREFGDAELAALAKGSIHIDPSVWPQLGGPSQKDPNRRGAAPGNFTMPALKEIESELARLKKIDFPYKETKEAPMLGVWRGIIPNSERFPLWGSTWTNFFGDSGKPEKPKFVRRTENKPYMRQKRQFDQLVTYTQNLLPQAAAKRDEFVWKKLDTSSVDKLAKSQEPLRDHFAKEIIGDLPPATKPLNPRTRQIYDTPKFTGYEVVLDLYDDVICHGILLVPKDLKPGEKRPVIVCQHGLEGRPTDVCDPTKKTQYYNSFGAQLAERGFIVFAPQNPYIFKNDFRQLVRKGNPLGITLYSFIVRQHERILDWLTTLPFVDGSRIAYYGLSYGGKVAMRIPVLIGRYCVVICSGDFNEWIWKNITLDWVGSYMFSGEYEMYEFNLGNTFNYAEMAALIAPRPFMVERGHNDGVGLDEYVAFEYAKVRRFYAKLGLADRTEIEFFNGGHVINGQGTFAFLHRHLNWPAPK